MANIWRTHTTVNKMKKHVLKHFAKINANSMRQYHCAATLSSTPSLFNSNHLDHNRHCHDDLFILFPNYHASSFQFIHTARDSDTMKKRDERDAEENETLRRSLDQMATYYDAVRPRGSSIDSSSSGATPAPAPRSPTSSLTKEVRSSSKNDDDY
ncbi:hypothetical protein PIB30_050940 [Stylosanthes scabra]|uniref:Uncharacterized protein n=1 Tax=Stylosanthes scabra TaxID=79078 RepID=A0ABU6SHM3_9FABA|nr:hypothetical protein [Stylosanthes scabra]